MTTRRLPHNRPAPRIEPDRDDLGPGLCVTEHHAFDAVIDGRARDLEYATAAAKEVCSRCPLTGVDGPCLKANPKGPGIVAGLTVQQRAGLKRQSPCGTSAAYQRHMRNGEEACLVCRVAEADRSRAKREAAA